MNENRAYVHSLSAVIGRPSAQFKTACVLLGCVENLSLLLGPLFIQLAIDTTFTDPSIKTIITIIALALTLNILSPIAANARGALVARSGNLSGHRASAKIFGTALLLPVSWYMRRQPSDIMLATASANSAKDVFLKQWQVLVYDAPLLVLSLGMLAWYSIPLLILGLVFAVLIGVTRLYTSNLDRAIQKRILALHGAESDWSINVLRSIKAIKMHGAEQKFVRRSCEISKTLYEERLLQQTLMNRSVFLVAILRVADQVVATLIMCLLILTNSATVGALFAALAYKALAIDRVIRICQAFIDTKIAAALGENISKITGATLERRDGTARLPRRDPQELSLFQVSYSAPGAGELISDVSLVVPPGETIAIIGPSGAGKSTLVQLICGLLEPTAGTMKIGGVNRDGVAPEKWRKTFSAVLQDDTLLPGTILENITFFSKGVDVRRALRCLEMACLCDPRGKPWKPLDTQISAFGDTLSGGERQRILIARALYKNASILLLDESTSMLDIMHEQRILDSLMSKHQSKIVVSHRPSVLRRADRVYHVLEGKVCELASLPLRAAALVSQEA